MTVIWIAQDTKTFKYEGLFTSKDEAIDDAMGILGRRGIATPLLLDERLTSHPRQSLLIAEVIIKLGRVEDIVFKDLLPHKNLMSKNIQSYCYIHHLIPTLNEVSPKVVHTTSFSIHIQAINPQVAYDTKNQLLDRLVNMGPKEPRYILMECQDIYE